MTSLDLGTPVPFATLCAIRAALLAPDPDTHAIARTHGVTLAVVRWAAKGTGVALGAARVLPRRRRELTAAQWRAWAATEAA